MYAIVALLGSMAASGCKHLWLAIAFIAVLSLLVPVVLLATGKLKMPLIHGISYVCSIGLLLFGGIAIVFGMFGLITDAGFLANACGGVDLATRVTLKAFGYAAKGF